MHRQKDYCSICSIYVTDKRDKDTLEAGLHELRVRIDPSEFELTIVLNSKDIHAGMYAEVSAAMLKYEINFTTYLPKPAPVWKKLLYTIWPHDATTIVNVT